MFNHNYNTMRRNSRRYRSTMRRRIRCTRYMLLDSVSDFIAINATIIAACLIIFAVSGVTIMTINSINFSTKAAEVTEEAAQHDYAINNYYVTEVDRIIEEPEIVEPEVTTTAETIEVTETDDSNVTTYEVEEITTFVEEVDEPEEVETIVVTTDDIETIAIEDTDIITEDCEPDTLENQLGNNIIKVGDTKFVKHNLPNVYYPGIDFSSFQPYMPYTAITNKGAPAYHVVNSELCYTDELGLRRYSRDSETEFTVNGEDDYVVALGTFYKEKGVVGNRYLIVTTTGMYTATTGDEKSDSHTDEMHMFTTHGNNKAGVIEWLVDKGSLNRTIARAGTITVGGPEAVQGEILYIYEIQ